MKRIVCLISVLLLLSAIPVFGFAQNEGQFVYDEADLLTDAEEASLNIRAAACANQYGTGVYIVTVNSFSGNDVFTFAENVYLCNGFGIGSEQNGILLLLSMEYRDYALAAYGSNGHYAFTDFAKQEMSDRFCEKFGSNDWAGGFASYLSSCETDLRAAADGKPVDVPKHTTQQYLIFCAAVPIGVALIVCLILKSGMKSARLQKNANGYIPQNGVRLNQKIDQYTHTTERREKIQKSSGSGGGGTSVRSSGFSGHSGKF